ncbi:GntP family permease [Salidesulfovibrio onnuriiensis]|uniref:GntP family permease n=1 Tax=Salidesulfovibrio onnuriiensis TaxID=2583823 RepID=UPI0011C9BBCA|nr:GntP family permease [Salidesulfovibrio onnuriiensis]
MVSGGIAVLILLLCVGLIVYLTSKHKMNAFVVLIFTAFLFGIMVQMPLPDIVKTIRDGFGGTLGYIGIVIVAGTIIGTILERTGAALAMTQGILRVIGKERSPLAMSVAGYVVSIPVFCDSGYVILSPLNKALAKQSGKAMATMAIALATGLYATHCLVPPTPGPIAAAGILGADLGRVIGFGLLVSIPGMLAGYFWAVHFAKRYNIEIDGGESYEELMSKYGRLPGGIHSSLPILVPILLILFKSVASYPTNPLGEGTLRTVLQFIGDPVTALMAGILIAMTLIRKDQLKEALDGWMNEGVKNAALILAITGAGGAFGRMLKSSPLSDFLGANLSSLELGIFLPFIIASAIKTAQGSSTVSIITTASIMAPLMASLGLDPAYTVLAIGAGAMTVSHANDSFFWVVSQFSGMDTPMAYKTYTTATAILGVTTILAVALVSVIF